MVQKGTRRAFDIFYVPVAVLAPQLAVLPTDHFRLEANSRGRGHVWRDFGSIVTLRIASDAEYGILVGKRTVDGGEYQRGATGSGVLMGDEANGREVL